MRASSYPALRALPLARGRAFAVVFFAGARSEPPFAPSTLRLQRIHQIDDVGLAVRRLRLDRHALLLGADQLDQRVLVTVLELLRLELAGHLLDDVLGEIEHLLGQLGVGDLVEIAGRRVHLVGVVQAGGDDALVARLQHQDALAPEQHDAREAHHFLGAHGIADDGERFLADAVGGREIVGRVEIQLVDLVARHEALDIDGVVAFELDRLDLVVLDLDELALGDLVALDLVVGLDRIAGLLVHELAPHAIAGLAIEGAEGNALGRGGRGIKRHRTRDEGKLQIAFPVRPGCHDAGSCYAYETVPAIILRQASANRPGILHRRP